VRHYGLSHNILKAKNMGLIKEPKNVDLSTKSEPWTKLDLADFRKIMHDIKAKNAKRKERVIKNSKKNKQPLYQETEPLTGGLLNSMV
jgi:hypothetical protein